MPTPPPVLSRSARRAGVAIVLSCLGTALAGCPAGPPAGPPASTVKVGMLAGAEDGRYGTDAVRGAQLAVEVVNEIHPDIALPLAARAGLPGLRGAPLALAVADPAGEPDAAEAAMAELSATGVVGVVSAEPASVVELAGAYADRQQLPMVDGASTAGFLLDIGFDWYFRTGPNDRTLTDAVLSLLPPANPGGAGRVTVLTPGGGRGADTAALLAEQARAAGFEVTDSVALGEPGDGDGTGDGYDSGGGTGEPGDGARIAAAGPDVLIAVAPAPGDGPDLHRAIDEWRAVTAGTLPADQAPAGLVVGLGLGFAGPESAGMEHGMLHATAWSPELANRQPVARAVAALYQERFETPMTEAGALAFTATITLVTAVDAAGSTEPAAVRAALRRLSTPATQTIMPWNGVRFGDTGQNELAAAVVDQRSSRAVQLVYPPELALADLAWPPPAPDHGQ